MKRKIVVLLSGGLDSTTLLYYHVRQGEDVRALTFNYGQRHKKEILLAQLHARRLNVPLDIVDLSSLAALFPGCSQTDPAVAVPEGHYEEESMKQTVVPNRNMILLAVAVGSAIAHGAECVAYAAHTGDHAIYPDCRPEFIEALQGAVNLCDWKKVELLRPFMDLTKAQIVSRGVELGVHFAETWSCYKGQTFHCGKCGTCVERREAFSLAGVPDPTLYAV